MSRCEDDEDERPATPELLNEAVAHATDFLFEACPGVATRVTRGPNGEHGAIFIIKDLEDVKLFMELYAELFELTDERVEVVRAVACNVPPDYGSN